MAHPNWLVQQTLQIHCLQKFFQKKIDNLHYMTGLKELARDRPHSLFYSFK